MTKALEMPVAIVLPHMEGSEHQCHAKRETGPCPHPGCTRGHDADTYFVAERADPLPLNMDEFDAMVLALTEVKKVAFSRREWRHGRWPGLAVFAWRRPDVQELGLPLDILTALPEKYRDELLLGRIRMTGQEVHALYSRVVPWKAVTDVQQESFQRLAGALNDAYGDAVATATQKAFDAGVVAERARAVEGLRRDGELLKKPEMSNLMEMVVATTFDNADKIEAGYFSDTSGAKEFLEVVAEKKE